MQFGSANSFNDHIQLVEYKDNSNDDENDLLSIFNY